MKRLEGKKAVVTGAAQGLGAAIVERLAQEGCDVVAWDMNADGIAQTAWGVAQATGRNVTGAAVDVTDAEDVRAHMETAARVLGGLDVLVSNAGILVSGDSLEFDVAKWRKVIDVNLTGYFICAREAARMMLDAGARGSIIQINSKSGKKGSFRNSAYAASKFGGIGVTQSLALEFAEAGIRVNSICPGNLLDSPLWVNSLFKQYAANQGITEAEVRQKYIDQVPMKRPCQYRDVTNLVVFMASDDSDYMTGQALNVTGGQEMR
ncbi:MAG TPA: sorbitol-6-phosphate dehydrogenase [Candidatus Hydrogenedentes bacterium]|nr:sorbitol-6-phosphate dehydrogenase [Candidatus Hydrogenedentota bacterium]HOS01937.1 sorbitol-6-phosphate dehydrogenase [Candidatus Hydrogenedentota bacterium]